jgi:hypothetical protein
MLLPFARRWLGVTAAVGLPWASHRLLGPRLAQHRGLSPNASWCQHHQIHLFAARRADIECFARDLEAHGRARATITRRLCTIAGFCKYAVEEELLDHSPAAHVRRPRLDYESPATGLDRNNDPARATYRAGDRSGHRERADGPIFVTADGRRLDRHGAGRIDRRIARQAGIAKRVGPTRCDMLLSLPPLTPESAARRAGSCLARRSAHHALRPGPNVPRPACHLYRRRLRCRSRPVRVTAGAGYPPGRNWPGG